MDPLKDAPTRKGFTDGLLSSERQENRKNPATPHRSQKPYP